MQRPAFGSRPTCLLVVLVAAICISCGSANERNRAPTSVAVTAIAPTLDNAASDAQANMFSLSSDAGSDGGLLPVEYTCDGAGSSPALSWTNAPEGTKEFALLMTTIPIDGKTKWNWVLYAIPATVMNLSKNSSGVGILGAGSEGEPAARAYQPPCSQGPGPKLYTFTIHALSGSPAIPADPGQVTGDGLTKAISSITLASASLNLSYTRAGQ